MTSLMRARFPLATPFLLLWIGIPLWTPRQHPGTAPGFSVRRPTAENGEDRCESCLCPAPTTV
jgi:hypothetical protein